MEVEPQDLFCCLWWVFSSVFARNKCVYLQQARFEPRSDDESGPPLRNGERSRFSP